VCGFEGSRGSSLAPQWTPNIELAGRVLNDLGVFWGVEEDPDAKRELPRLIFERVGLDDGHVVAVRPKEAVRILLRRRQDTTAEKRCLKDGSDGTRTRDLRFAIRVVDVRSGDSWS
jgi:hypothetical protein